MYLIVSIEETKFRYLISIEIKDFTWAAALAKLSKALVIASVCCWWLIVFVVSIVSVFILQSMRRFVVLDVDDVDEDEDGGERYIALKYKVIH